MMIPRSIAHVDFDKGSLAPLHRRSWGVLLAAVREYAPDVVVLIARKTPRISELLHLDFGPASIVSDIAIPYEPSLFRHARVAIIDDVVNVGSTLNSVHKRVMAAGAAKAQLFAVASYGRAWEIAGEVSYAEESVWPEQHARSLSSRLPQALLHMNKPYDVEFPIIPCTILPPFATSRELLSKLKERFGTGCVFDVTHPQAAAEGLHRWTVVLPQLGDSNFKVRLYADIRNRTCNIVPFAIHGCGSKGTERLEELLSGHKSLADVFSALMDFRDERLEAIPGESAFRAVLFLESWMLGLSLIDLDLADMVAVVDDTRISLSDVQLVFGPHIRQCFEAMSVENHLFAGDHGLAPHSKVKSSFSGSVAGLYRRFRRTPAFRSVLQSNGDPFDVFMSLFQSLALVVGAENPNQYSLDWPFDRRQVADDPYLRLRVGFTFVDLVELCNEVAQATGEHTLSSPCYVSTMLDWAIDQGGVVPVVTSYDGWLCRVYRKGERDIDNEGARRACFSAANFRKPISRTRMAKIFAILSYSACLPQAAVPSALSRGNVGVFPAASVLDDDNTDITRYFRDTGRLKGG